MTDKSNPDCVICGHCEYQSNEVLWGELIDDWQLGTEEVGYINKQQGYCCIQCGCNFRSIALASAILTKYDYKGTFEAFVCSIEAKSIRVLEINEAGNLTPFLQKMPNYLFVTFPQEDMTNLSFADKTYDLVIHSDTLEHINDPVKALSECRRVLRDNGACIFTIPIIAARMSRTRDGLKNSYHGNEHYTEYDYKVYTEFGADFWVYAFNAGFCNVNTHCFDFPSALAIIAQS